MIANFDEFNHYIDSLFASGSVSDFASYHQALALSKNKRKAKIASISQQINELLKLIEQARINIKQASSDDKKSQGQVLNTYIQIKQALVKQYKEAKNITLFTELTTDAKVYACTKSLLLKYLPNELGKIPYLSMPQDEQGNLIFVPDKIEETPLDRNIHHIIDYVTSYLENYPEKVRGAKHFTGLHKKCTDMNELIEEIDAYFAKLNSPTEKEANRIKKSHSGFEVVMNMPEYGLQAVRLLTKPALQYEGSAMHHCVGSYATKVEKGETAIYSIRLIADENNAMIPVATIEYKEGKLNQIKGPHDKEISFIYLQGVRDFILYLTGKKDMAEIASDDTVKDKQNIGIIKDNTGVYRDIYTLIENENYCFDNIHIEASSLPHIPTDHLSVKTLTIHGKLKAEDLKYLSSFNVQSTIHFEDLDFAGEQFDLSLLPVETIILDFKQAKNLKTMILSDKTKSLRLKGDCSLKSLVLPDNVELLSIQGNFSDLQQINFPANLKTLNLEGSFGFNELVLPDKLLSFTYKNKTDKCLPIKLNYALQNLKLNGKIALNNILVPLPNLITLDLEGINDADITSLNLTHLKELNLMDAKLENLRELIASPDTIHICMNQGQFPKLELLDFSATNIKTFGRLYTDANIPSVRPLLGSDDYTVSNFPQIIGVSYHEALMPNLKQVKYPHDIETLDFSLTFFDYDKIVDFSAYPNLKTITTRDFTNIDMTQQTQTDTTAILTRRQAVNY